MRVVLCPAPLKGVLSARAAAAALAEGFGRAGVEAELVPLADGGEGTLDAFDGEGRVARVSDPLGRPVEARWLLLPDGRAVVEAATVIGLSLLAPDERDPMRASSRGLGELMLAAAGAGARGLLVGLGDTATVDGGAGLREELKELPAPTTALCDVSNPLLDAARVFAAQKGASLEEAELLERRLASMDELRPFVRVPGGGAAGGIGAALAALGARLVSGADYVVELVGLANRIREADLVVTGEGTVDRTSIEGKSTGVVVRLCTQAGVRCAVFGGRVDKPLAGGEMHTLSGDPEQAREDLVALGKKLAA
jgi:glycerate kinase